VNDHQGRLLPLRDDAQGHSGLACPRGHLENAFLNFKDIRHGLDLVISQGAPERKGHRWQLPRPIFNLVFYVISI